MQQLHTYYRGKKMCTFPHQMSCTDLFLEALELEIATKNSNVHKYWIILECLTKNEKMIEKNKNTTN